MPMIPRGLFATVAVVVILAASPLVFAQTRTTIAAKTGSSPPNCLSLYYEIHGTGEPLILLHGGLGATEMFGEILPFLSGTRQVISGDFQAHGRSAVIYRPLTYDAMA